MNKTRPSSKAIGQRGLFILLTLLGLSVNVCRAAVDNAALYYYQALLQCPADRDLFHDEMQMLKRGEDISNVLRERMELYRVTVIPPIEMGTQMDRCEWGLPIPFTSYDEMDRRGINLHKILWADVCLRLADGDGEGAIKSCLTLHQLNCHMAQDADLGRAALVSEIVYFFKAMKQIVESERLSPQTLLRLEEPLGQNVNKSMLINSVKADAKDSEYLFEQSWKAPGSIQFIRNFIDPESTDHYKEQKKDWDRYDDEELHALIRNRYAKFTNQLCLELKDVKPPYNLAFLKIHEKLSADDNRDDPLFADYLGPDDLYEPMSRFLVAETKIGALKAALAIYLIKAQTGELPETAPPGFPTNPYDNEAFKYTVTENGFKLSYIIADGPYGRPQTKDIEFQCPDK